MKMKQKQSWEIGQCRHKSEEARVIRTGYKSAKAAALAALAAERLSGLCWVWGVAGELYATHNCHFVSVR